MESSGQYRQCAAKPATSYPAAFLQAHRIRLVRMHPHVNILSNSDTEADALNPIIILRKTGAREGIRALTFNLGKEILDGGAGGRNRTDTLSPELDFESSASTSSATPAYRHR